jgi:hypothetical protein
VPTDPRLGFMQIILGPKKGYLAAPYRLARDKRWEEKFYAWPEKAEEFLADTREQKLYGDIYFCPTILSHPERVKENVDHSYVLWADLDTCHPSNLLVDPSVVVQSSAGRWQCYWILDKETPAATVEILNKRIAYYHADEGCDKSGWDLTQVLRFPDTKNHKYLPDLHDVRVLVADPDKVYSVDVFDVYPEVDYLETTLEPMPDVWPKDSAEEILGSVRYKVNPMADKLFNDKPRGDWSKSLWQLEQFLFAAGLDAPHVYVVVKEAACNKYRRDNRPDSFLWNDVCRAKAASEAPAHRPSPVRVNNDSPETSLQDLQLLTKAEREWAQSSPTIVEDYIDWAKTVGDAAWQYHQAGAFIILSTLLAGNVRLPTSYGTLVPNIWFMILADTTLTRKSTAMDLAMDMLVEIDSDSMLATDGSIEGLMTSLSMRPSRPSVFLRDEFSGLLEMLTKKDYYAGMLETLTKLYDGKYQKRVLRKETLELRDPVLILFTGGIRTKILSLLTNEHVSSGFIPRFVFVTAESDVGRLKPIGPPTFDSLEGRSELISRFTDIWSHYQQVSHTPAPGQIALPKSWDATMTPDAWRRYNILESMMLDAGVNSQMPEILTPTLDRLCKSGLKMAVLLAAASRLDERVVVEETDLIRAFAYIDDLKQYTLEVVANVGKGVDERLMERIYLSILNRPQQSRSDIMRGHRLTSRQADQIFRTLVEREMITPVKSKSGAQMFEAIQLQQKVIQ